MYLFVDQGYSIVKVLKFYMNTVKPANEGHPWERQYAAFIGRLSLFGGLIVLNNQ